MSSNPMACLALGWNGFLGVLRGCYSSPPTTYTKGFGTPSKEEHGEEGIKKAERGAEDFEEEERLPKRMRQT